MARLGRRQPNRPTVRRGFHGDPSPFSREFNGSSDNITTAIGSLADLRDGNLTIAAIMKVPTTPSVDKGIVEFHGTPALRCGLVHGGSNTPIGLQDDGGGAYVSPPPAFGVNVWTVVAITRSAGVLRAHIYDYNTATWAHGDGPTVTAVNDTLTSVRLGGLTFGAFQGRIAVAAAQVGAAHSDVNIETLTVGLQEWVDLFTGNAAVWRLDQATTADPVPDIVGAADQTAISGTTVVADSPAGFDWTLGGAPAGDAQGTQRATGTATGLKTAQRAATGQLRPSGAVVSRKQWVAAAAGALRTSGQDAARKQATGAASGAQRSSGAAVARKQALGAAQGHQRTAGLAERAPTGPSGAAQGTQRATGTATGVKAAAGAAQHRQRSTAQTGYDYYDEYLDTYLTATGGVKGAAGVAAGRQRSSGATGSFKGGAAQGSMRTSGTTAGQHRGVGVAAGVQRTSGQTVVIHRGVGAAAGAQRTSGFTTAEPSGSAVGSQRTSGTTTGTKAAIRGTQGQARTAGAATGQHRGVGAAAGAQRTSGTCVSRKTAAVGVATGQQRTSGAVASIHRGVGVAQGRQRTTGVAAALKGGRGAAAGQQRTDGFVVRQPPVIWATGIAGTQLAAVGVAAQGSDEGGAVLELAAVGVATTE